MQSVTWISFSLSTAMTKSIVHFFPSAGSITAPYTAQCRLTLFGNGLEQSSVILEGARMSQPDGVRLSDAFPHTNEQTAGLYGLEIELTGSQPRLDLTHSSVVVEFRSKSNSVRFRPLCLNCLPGTVGSSEDGVFVKDAFTSTSIVLLNNSSSSGKPDLGVRRIASDGEPYMLGIPAPEIGSGQVIEVSIDDASLDTKPSECSWGITRAERLYCKNSRESGVFGFVLHRDATTKQPINVFAL